MKENFVIKRIAVIIVLTLVLQYVNLIVPSFKVISKTTDENMSYELYEINDVQLSSDFDYERADKYEHMIGASRKDGKINYSIPGGKFDSYSFDKVTWEPHEQLETIPNIEANTIYTKYTSNSGEISYYDLEIAEEGKLKEILGTYNDMDNSYIFGHDRNYSGENYTVQENGETVNKTKFTIINDENKIQQFKNGNILDMTKVAGDVFILKQDGIVYKMGSSYNDLNTVTGGTNIYKIDGVYAVDNANNILKCSYNYDNNTYSYVKCDYKLESKVKKLSSVIIDNVMAPYILYESGKAVILKSDGSIKEVADNVIDISGNGKDYYAIQNNTSIYNGKTIDISTIVNKDEIPVRINNKGIILTNNGNYYKPKIESSSNEEEISITYLEKEDKTGIVKLGDYTYQDKNGNVYYIENDEQIQKKVDNISITKDESKLNLDKVYIKVQVPENTYTVVLPDGNSSIESNLTYEVTKNGEYIFEFTDVDGNTVIRVVHVNNIQSRKDTKVPKVTAVNGQIKLESDSKIEYSLDNKTWEEYTKEIKYKEPIYAKIKDDNFECSILKITINENGELDVLNTEQRELQGEILTNGIGENKYNEKVMNYKTEIKNKTEEEPKEEKKSFFKYISEIADNIIYSFSSTDGKYAGCYFEDNVTEITYKNMDNNDVSISNDKLNVHDIINNNCNISYSVISKEYKEVSCNDSTEENEKQKLENGEIYAYEPIKIYMGGYYADYWKETYAHYAYIDSNGSLISDIQIINKAKDIIEEKNKNTKYTKIIGDGVTFYILTQEGEVYLVTEGDNGTYRYLEHSLAGFFYGGGLENAGRIQYIISKLDLKDVVNIYDSCTALTKDGKIVSLIKDNEQDTSVVQELQKQTDKYLIASHLGLKDGKLYNFDNVKEAIAVTAGKVVKTDNASFGVYSENKKSIKILDINSKSELIIPELKEGESFIDVQSIDKKLPEFVDIAEFRNSYLTRLLYSYYTGGAPSENELKEFNYNNADKYAMVYALAEDGQVWIYIGGYVVDTGINLNLFGPTANYTLDNTKWTNQNINLDFTANTTSKIIAKKIKKGNDVIAENNPITIEKNGEYSIEITDNEARSYITTLNVGNIDKIKPDVAYRGKIENGIANIVAYDIQDATGDYAKSGIARIELTYETPTKDTQWTTINGDINDEGKMTAQVKQSDTTKFAYVRAIDNAGNISITRKIEFKEEIKPEEPEIPKEPEEEEFVMPKTGQSRASYLIVVSIIIICTIVLITTERLKLKK